MTESLLRLFSLLREKKTVRVYWKKITLERVGRGLKKTSIEALHKTFKCFFVFRECSFFSKVQWLIGFILWFHLVRLAQPQMLLYLNIDDWCVADVFPSNMLSLILYKLRRSIVQLMWYFILIFVHDSSVFGGVLGHSNCLDDASQKNAR